MSLSEPTEEYLDALTPTGELIGPRPRSECHRDGLWHRVIHMWVANSKGELLVQKRAACKESFPSLWDISVAGHMSSGDTARVACQREAEEELGLHVEDQELIYVYSTTQSFVLRNGTYKDNEFVEVFLIQREVRLEDLVLQQSEVDDVKWMNWREVKKGTLDSVAYNFVPIHSDYEPFWAFLESKFPNVQ